MNPRQRQASSSFSFLLVRDSDSASTLYAVHCLSSIALHVVTQSSVENVTTSDAFSSGRTAASVSIQSRVHRYAELFQGGPHLEVPATRCAIPSRLNTLIGRLLLKYLYESPVRLRRTRSEVPVVKLSPYKRKTKSTKHNTYMKLDRFLSLLRRSTMLGGAMPAGSVGNSTRAALLMSAATRAAANSCALPVGRRRESIVKFEL